jgi:hypothetical protein
MTEKKSNTVSYWESRQINIGDYESITCGVSVSCDIDWINQMEARATIKSSAKVKVDSPKDTLKAVMKAQKIVKKALDKRELTIRTLAEDFLDGESRIDKLSINQIEPKKVKRNRQYDIDEDDE